MSYYVIFSVSMDIFDEKIFKWFLPYMGMAAILVHVTRKDHSNKLSFSILRSVYMVFELNWPNVFQRKCLKMLMEG